MQDRVAQARLYMAWTGPRWGTRDAHQLELAAAVLAGDKNSRLYQRLVYKDQLASDIEFGPLALEIAGITYPATVKISLCNENERPMATPIANADDLNCSKAGCHGNGTAKVYWKL